MKLFYTTFFALITLTSHSLIAQVSKSDSSAATLNGFSVDRSFEFDSSEIAGNITEVEMDLTLSVTDNFGCAPGALGYHDQIAARLRSPSGTEVNFIQDANGFLGTPVGVPTYDQNVQNIISETATFDDDATEAADDQNNFATGTWRPHNPFSIFDGENPVGTWTLTIADGVQLGFTDFLCYLSSTLRITTDTSLDVNTESFEQLSFLYPNPASDFIQVSNLKKEEFYTMIDLNGRLIKKGIVTEQKNIDVREITSGLYIVKLNNQTFKVIIRR